MIIETHVHLCDEKYDADRDAMLVRASAAGVVKFVNIGAEMKETRKVAVYDRPGVYKALGLHPHAGHEFNDAVAAEFKSFFKEKKNIVAVGEIGLDYYKSTTPKDLQESVFRSFLALSREFDLPVVIHSREAHEDVLRILNEYDIKKHGIIHCFTGDAAAAGKFVDAGYALGIGGVITFPNAGVLKETVKSVELRHFVLETDAPWLAPQQVRGTRNEPANLRFVVEAIAGIKGISADEVERVTTATAERVLGIG